MFSAAAPKEQRAALQFSPRARVECDASLTPTSRPPSRSLSLLAFTGRIRDLFWTRPKTRKVRQSNALGPNRQVFSHCCGRASCRCPRCCWGGGMRLRFPLFSLAFRSPSAACISWRFFS